MDLRRMFVSHGAPTLPLEDHPARHFLESLGPSLHRPRAIVIVSPHWMTQTLEVKSPLRFTTWHDYSGFPPALDELRYDAPGDADLRDRVLHGLEVAGLDAKESDDVRLDHGAWVPLTLMYPACDVPIVQVSLTWQPPAWQRRLGSTLDALLADDELLLGSGGFVHNLREFCPGSEDVPDWASTFDDWMDARVREGDWTTLDDYRIHAPAAAQAHPTEDHLLPLYVAAAAAGPGDVLHRSFAHGPLGMSAYGFR